MEDNSKQAADVALESEGYLKLKKSYDCLRRDYTKKCQELGRMKREWDNISDKREMPSDTPPKPDSITAEDRDKIIMEYIQSVKDKKPPILISGGGSFNVSQPRAPKTLKEAGEIAKRYISRH